MDLFTSMVRDGEPQYLIMQEARVRRERFQKSWHVQLKFRALVFKSLTGAALRLVSKIQQIPTITSAVAGFTLGAVEQFKPVFFVELICPPHSIKRFNVALFVTAFSGLIQKHCQKSTAKPKATRLW